MMNKEFYDFIIDRMELFYRNFGAEWCVDDLVIKPKEKALLREFLLTLEKEEIVNVIGDDRFIIIDLPSKYKTSNLNNE
ncbi:hypothetical protein VSP10_15650 [Myroides odoratimimus]|uniref:hypothetical protein n=1 Tax=Myroides TaxID=76831 RepID=UPI000246096B|nr:MULTISPECIES: hypothetical protein [Myroides]EHO09055.1 hypothetical protein HMPREF9714_02028 [Myroides odoratimimus CCUG 12901]MCO7724444.1 hypothetical protein [Myroides odoratimimus]MDO5857740.1 hypothetical protein [Myroides odoratimimus]MDX4975271.1 hypothetical protein [Myroides odoratimimus]MEC4028972.1 hypothetical protein [Myroides odoratimimus]